MSANKLFSPFKLGGLELKNRVVMAPMTRCRATQDHLPTEPMIKYYADRADAGLIITEGTAPAANGAGYARIPGIYSDQQIAGWKKITGAVHAKGGRMFMQLMHTGRATHTLSLPAGERMIAPSAIGLSGEIWTDQQQMQPYPVPAAMTAEEVETTINAFVSASMNAMAAGFDGIELHGANGYLIDQFLNTASNQRTDIWGGSISNRTRFAVEAAKRVAAKIGANRVGMRISPYGLFNDMKPDSEMDAMYAHLIAEISTIGLAYIHVVDHSSMGAPEVKPAMKAMIRKNFRGAYILSGGYDASRAGQDLENGLGDLVAFGRPFISNPDLVDKLKSGQGLAAADASTFYTPGEPGYNSYAA